MHHACQYRYRTDGCTNLPNVAEAGDKCDRQRADHGFPGDPSHERIRFGDGFTCEQDTDRSRLGIPDRLIDGEVGFTEDHRAAMVKCVRHAALRREPVLPPVWSRRPVTRRGS